MKNVKLAFLNLKKTLIIIIFLMCSLGVAEQKHNDLIVYAPSSLREAIDEVIFLYNTKYPSRLIKPIYMGTAQLAQQIKNGASPDIFISANPEWMDYLDKKQLTKKEYRVNYVYNSLVAITKKENNSLKKIKNIEAFKNTLLTVKNRISLAMTMSVPAGIYSKVYLENTGIWNDIKDNIVESSNVRAAMKFISRGDLDIGIVYYSDAISEKKIKIIYFLEERFHSKIVYPLTVLNEAENTLNFYNFLIAKNSKLIMKKWGFKVKK